MVTRMFKCSLMSLHVCVQPVSHRCQRRRCCRVCTLLQTPNQPITPSQCIRAIQQRAWDVQSVRVCVCGSSNHLANVVGLRCHSLSCKKPVKHSRLFRLSPLFRGCEEDKLVWGSCSSHLTRAAAAGRSLGLARFVCPIGIVQKDGGGLPFREGVEQEVSVPWTPGQFRRTRNDPWLQTPTATASGSMRRRSDTKTMTMNDVKRSSLKLECSCSYPSALSNDERKNV